MRSRPQHQSQTGQHVAGLGGGGILGVEFGVWGLGCRTWGVAFGL